MRLCLVMLCLLMNLSVLLTPFDTTHAHVDAAAALTMDVGAEVHSGHSHDLDGHHDHDHEPASPDEQIVDLHGSMSAQNPLQSMFWSGWMPLLCLVALTFLVAQFCIAVFAPPASDPRPASRHGYWRPPLRGPPAFSIH